MAGRGKGTNFNVKGAEVARQDVMVTKDGPIELMRRDQHGNFNQIPNDQVRFLSNKYKSCHEGDNFRPIETNHGPGLYRNHISVKGDAVHMRKMNRNFVFHRRPFDWYNGNRFNLIDDIEEVLEPVGRPYETGGHLSKYHKYKNDYSSQKYRYNPDERYRSRSACRSQSRSCSHSRSRGPSTRDQSRDSSVETRSLSRDTRSPSREFQRNDYEDDTIYIVKKKEPEVKFNQEPLKPAIKYEYPKYVAPTSTTSTKITYNQPKEYTKTVPGSSVIYHGSSTTSGTTNYSSNPTITSYSSQMGTLNESSNSPANTLYNTYSSGTNLNNSKVIYHGNSSSGQNLKTSLSPVASKSNYSHSIDSSNYTPSNKSYNSQVTYHGSNSSTKLNGNGLHYKLN